MDFLPAYCRYQAMLPSEPPKKLTPAPAKVIFDVEANTNGRFGLLRGGRQTEHVDRRRKSGQACVPA